MAPKDAVVSGTAAATRCVAAASGRNDACGAVGPAGGRLRAQDAPGRRRSSCGVVAAAAKAAVFGGAAPVAALPRVKSYSTSSPRTRSQPTPGVFHEKWRLPSFHLFLLFFLLLFLVLPVAVAAAAAAALPPPSPRPSSTTSAASGAAGPPSRDALGRLRRLLPRPRRRDAPQKLLSGRR